MKEFHPAADIFPLMQEQEFSAFVADIRTNGLRHPIFLHADGRILDGRNRYRACLKTGIEPRFETAPETDSLVRLLLSLNLHRRHLTSDQRACCAVELLPWLEKEAKERQRAQGHRGKEGGRGKNKTLPQKIGSSRKHERESAQQAAELLNTNRQYVSDVKKLAAEDPQAFQRVKSGDASLMHVKRRETEADRESRREQNRQLVQATNSLADLAGKARFSTIVVDPPGNTATKAMSISLGVGAPHTIPTALPRSKALLDPMVQPQLKPWWTKTVTCICGSQIAACLRDLPFSMSGGSDTSPA